MKYFKITPSRTVARFEIIADVFQKVTEAAYRLLERTKELDESTAPFADYTMVAAYMFDEDIRDGEQNTAEM